MDEYNGHENYQTWFIYSLILDQAIFIPDMTPEDLLDTVSATLPDNGNNFLDGIIGYFLAEVDFDKLTKKLSLEE
jgi:hypothetical protein